MAQQWQHTPSLTEIGTVQPKRFSLSFSIIKQYGQQQTTETLFPNWDFVISSSIAVLPAGDGWPEVAVVLGSGQRVRNPPDRSNMDGIYLLAYSLTTGKTWKQRVVAGRGPFKEPALFSLTQSGPRLVVGEWARRAGTFVGALAFAGSDPSL